jgi:hypothetical protein
MTALMIFEQASANNMKVPADAQVWKAVLQQKALVATRPRLCAFCCICCY